MLLCHITNHLPSKDGKILSIFEAIGETRNSVHFTVNHPVQSHLVAGNIWNNAPFAILSPMKSTLKQRGNVFAGGIPIDFFSVGSVHLPKGTVIVRHGKGIPSGKLRVVDGKKIKEFKKIKGLKVVELPENIPVHDGVKTVMRKLGYQVRDSFSSLGLPTWGTVETTHKYHKEFFKFLKSKKLRPLMHSYTPNGMFDLVLCDLKQLSIANKSWQIISDGKIIYDYKKSIISMLNRVLEASKRNNLPVNYNMKAVKSLIKRATSPKEAIKLLEEELNIKLKAPIKVDPNAKTFDVYMKKDAYAFIGHTNFETAIDTQTQKAVSEYLTGPSEETFSAMTSGARETYKKFINSRMFKFFKKKEPDTLEMCGLL